MSAVATNLAINPPRCGRGSPTEVHITTAEIQRLLPLRQPRQGLLEVSKVVDDPRAMVRSRHYDDLIDKLEKANFLDIHCGRGACNSGRRHYISICATFGIFLFRLFLSFSEFLCFLIFFLNNLTFYLPPPCLSIPPGACQSFQRSSSHPSSLGQA